MTSNRSWFSELNTYVRKVLSEPGFVMQDECDREGRRLRENSKGFFNERYKGHREQFINEVQRFFQSYADDRLVSLVGVIKYRVLMNRPSSEPATR